MIRNRQTWLMLSTFLLTPMLCSVDVFARESIPDGWTGHNVHPVGYSSLDGHEGNGKLAIKRVEDRWYLYVTTLWESGWSILDVTDPEQPRYVRFVPGPWGALTNQVTVYRDLMMTTINLPRVTPDFPGLSDTSRTALDGPVLPEGQGGVTLWDISAPENPQPIQNFMSGGVTHRNSFSNDGYLFLSSKYPRFDSYILVVVDASDVNNPKEVSHWWMEGQKRGEASDSEVAPGFHGPVHLRPDGDMAVMGYTPAVVNLDVSDRSAPRLIGKLTMTPPFVSAGIQSVHSVVPLWDRQLLFVNSEAHAERCEKEALNFAALVDNADPAHPRLISIFPRPTPAEDSGYEDFCEKPGRFGPHNVHDELLSPDVQQVTDQIHLTYFNAGLRIFNIKNPLQPKEVAWFVPPDPVKRVGPWPRTGLVAQTNGVLVDARGYIYLTDRQWGLWIVKQDRR